MEQHKRLVHVLDWGFNSDSIDEAPKVIFVGYHPEESRFYRMAFDMEEISDVFKACRVLDPRSMLKTWIWIEVDDESVKVLGTYRPPDVGIPLPAQPD